MCAAAQWTLGKMLHCTVLPRVWQLCSLAVALVADGCFPSVYLSPPGQRPPYVFGSRERPCLRKLCLDSTHEKCLFSHLIEWNNNVERFMCGDFMNKYTLYCLRLLNLRLIKSLDYCLKTSTLNHSARLSKSFQRCRLKRSQLGFFSLSHWTIICSKARRLSWQYSYVSSSLHLVSPSECAWM